MRYMMFIKMNEDYRKTPPPAALMEAMGQFVGKAMNSGVLVDTGGLQPSSAGSRIRLKDGKMTVMDGPFTESKEVVGGYAIVEAATKREAMDMAMEFMELHRLHWPGFDGESEIRPMEVFDPSADQRRGH